MSLPWLVRPGSDADLRAADTVDLWELMVAVGLAVAAIGIALLSSRASANRLGWVLLVLAFFALAVVLAEYAEHAEYADYYATFDSFHLEVGAGMVTVIFAAAATVVDASFVLLSRKGGPPTVGPAARDA